MSVLAVAMRLDDVAAAVSRSSHSGPTTTSLLTRTTSRPVVAVEGVIASGNKPGVALMDEDDDVVAKPLLRSHQHVSDSAIGAGVVEDEDGHRLGSVRKDGRVALTTSSYDSYTGMTTTGEVAVSRRSEASAMEWAIESGKADLKVRCAQSRASLPAAMPIKNTSHGDIGAGSTDRDDEQRLHHTKAGEQTVPTMIITVIRRRVDGRWRLRF